MALVAALGFIAPAGAHPDSGPPQRSAHPATCDGKPVTFHVHRAHRLLRRAYASGPDHALIDQAQQHRRCIAIRSVRRQIGEFRKGLRPDPAQTPGGSIDPPGASYLAGLRACESGGNYATNTGNGFYGAYQFDLGTWASVGGSGLPSSAAPAEQDYRAAVLWRARGSAPWPVCG